MATDDPGLNSNGLTPDEQATFEGLYGADAGSAAEPKPGALAGWWRAAGAVPHALADVGLDVYGATNTALRNAVDTVTGAHDFSNLAGEPEGYGMGTPFKAAPDTLRSKVDTAADETAQQVADLRSTVNEMYRPDPHTTGSAGNILFGAVDPLVRIGVGALLTRGAGGLEFAAGTQGYERTQELEAQGVDPGTAAASGAISAGTFEAMGAVGGEEGSLASRVLKSGAVNFAGGIVNRGADSEVLKANGYDKLAQQEQWNDAQTMLSDALVGMAFPLVHEGINRTLDAAATRQESKLADKITANPELFDKLHDGTGYVPAANVDAALTSLNARNAADVAPGIPTDFTSQGMHYKALDAAIKQVANGDDVHVDPIVRGMNAIPRPVDQAKVAGITEALQDAQYPDIAAQRDEQISGVQSLELPDATRVGLIGMYQRAAQVKPVFDDAVQNIAHAVGGEAQIVPLKGYQRAAAKVVGDYGGDASKAKDIVRATIVVQDPQDAARVTQMMHDRYGEPVKHVSTLDPASEAFDESGYRGMNSVWNVNGHAVELQVNVPEMIRAKEQAHAMYEERSAIFRKANEEGRDATEGEAARIDQLNQSMADVYASAWRDATARLKADSESGSPSSRNTLADAGTGLPVDQSLARPSRESSDQGAPSTEANRVPGGNEAGNLLGSIAPTSDEIVPRSAHDDGHWVAFQPDSGTLGIPRSEMPQIKGKDRPAFFEFLAARGIGHEDASVPASSLRPTQAEFSPSMVDAFTKTGPISGRRVLISSDDYVLDGHHQALGHKALGTNIPVIRIDAPIREILKAADEFPMTQRSRGAGGVPASGPDASIRSSDAAYGTPDRHPWIELDTTKNIPLAGGVSADGKTIYISPYMPKTVEVDGKTIDAEEGVVVHEVEEQKVMLPDGPKDAEYMAALKADIASESKANPKSPKISAADLKKVARGDPLPYPKAHAIATIRENAFIRKTYGIDPEKYQAKLANGIEEARKKAAQEGNIPADLDRTPYEDTGLTRLLPNKPGGTLMQNRDRARAASLTQMAGIANAPDPQRLGFSRDPNTGAPMVSAANAAEAVPEADQGKQDAVIFADGRKIPIRYAVVEASDVAASHRSDGSVNPDYEGARLQALNNGRVAGVQAAWTGGKAQAYKAGLIAEAPMFGIDPKAITDKAQPMVIRLYDAAANFGDMGKASNESGSLGLSPSEQALTDARALPDLDTLPLTESGEISSRADDPFHRAFLRNLGVNDAAKLVDSNGRFNKVYLDRLRAALFARAYGDPALVEMQTEATDPVARNVLNGLTAAAPEWAKVDPGAPLGDYASRITAAMNLLREARESGESVAQKLAQGDLIARDTRGDKWAKYFADNARSPKLIGEALRDAARMIVAEQRRLLNGDLIGGGERDESDITRTVLKLAEDRYGHQQPRQSGNLFNAAGRAAGNAAARPAVDVARERGGEQAQGEGAAAGDAGASQRPAPEPGSEGSAARGAVADAADQEAGAGATGEAGGTGPAAPDSGRQDQQGRPGTGAPAPGDRDVARAREAVQRRPNLILPEGVTAAEAMRQADEAVAQAEREAAALKAAVDCFLEFGSDAA